MYPREFSPPARARVEAERLRAKRELEQAQTEEPPPDWWETNEWDRKAFYKYILRVFLAFAREGCQLGVEGTWTVDRIRSEVEEFLRIFAIHAYFELGRDRSGREFPEITEHGVGSLRSEVKQIFRREPEWREFEDQLLAVAEGQAGQKPAEGTRSVQVNEASVEGARSSDSEAIKTERCGLLTEFKRKASAFGIRVTDEMVARAANPGRWNDRTMVVWWKRNDPRCKPADDQKIRAVLTKDPASLWPAPRSLPTNPTK